MKIVRLDESNDIELTEFLDHLGSTSNGSMVLGYHYPGYRDTLLRVLGSKCDSVCFAARSEKTGRLVGVLPGIIGKGDSFAVYNSLPFFGPNVGVLADSESRADYATIATTLTEAVLDQCRAEGVLSAVFYSAFDPEGVNYPNLALDDRKDALRISRETLLLDFEQVTPDVWAADKKIRSNFRRAREAGVTIGKVSVPGDLDAMYEIYRRNCEVVGIPIKPRVCFDSLHAADREGRLVGSYVARLNQKIIASLLVLWSPKCVSYFQPGTDSEFRSLHPGSLLVDHVAREAIRRGVRYWNWESSPDRTGGVYHFKKKWGSRAAPFHLTLCLLGDVAPLEALGKAGIAQSFPYFFVYPFDLLRG